jgi:TBC1 domain family member 13
MNELLAPVYYVVANDPDPVSRYYAEADAFFCFTHLLGEVKDQFLPALDGAVSGMEGNIERLHRLLARADPELCLHLDTQCVDPRFYAIRWLTLLMTQEFQLPDLLRLWDSLLADPKQFELLAYFCCALLVYVPMYHVCGAI